MNADRPEGVCPRCGRATRGPSRQRLHFTGAFSLAALLLYAPANVLPILRFDMFGASSENTVWQGCLRLYEEGDRFVALVLFLASMAIPLLKLLGLLFLVLSCKIRLGRWKKARAWVFKVIEVIGRWSMLDVLALAVLVSIVKLRSLATIVAGPGALAFTLVVVFTTIASQCFDSRLIWEETEP